MAEAALRINPDAMRNLPAMLRAGRVRAADYLAMFGVQSFHDWLVDRSPEMNWEWPHLRYMQDKLDLMTCGAIDRLMFMAPPRHCKSELATVRYPVYRMENQAGFRAITGSYNSDSAKDFSRAARTVSRLARLYKHEQHAADGNSTDLVHQWTMRNGSIYRGVGVGSGIIGKGGDLIVIDDPIKNRAESDSITFRNRAWNWYSDLQTRLEPGGQIIISMHSWHQDDLVERILRNDKHGEWCVVRLPALAMAGDILGRADGEPLCPDRYPKDALERTRDNVQDVTWDSNYQQAPKSPKGSIFERAWWAGQNRFDIASAAFQSQAIDRIISMDTAMSDKNTANYTAAAVVDLQSDYRAALRYVERRKMKFPELVDFTVDLIARWYGTGGSTLSRVVIEDKASGTSLVQSLVSSLPRDMRRLIHPMSKTDSKETCYRAVTPWCRNGCVLLPHPSPAALWLHDLEEELYVQPNGEYDDQTDAFAQALDFYRNMLSAGLDARRNPTKGN